MVSVLNFYMKLELQYSAIFNKTDKPICINKQSDRKNGKLQMLGPYLKQVTNMKETIYR